MDFMGSANYGDENNPEWVAYREEATEAAVRYRVLMLAEAMDRDLRHSISADDLRAAVHGTADSPNIASRPDRWCPKWLTEKLCAQQVFAPDDFTRNEIG